MTVRSGGVRGVCFGDVDESEWFRACRYIHTSLTRVYILHVRCFGKTRSFEKYQQTAVPRPPFHQPKLVRFALTSKKRIPRSVQRDPAQAHSLRSRHPSRNQHLKPF